MYGHAMSIQEWADYIGQIRRQWARKKAASTDFPIEFYFNQSAKMSEEDLIHELKEASMEHCELSRPLYH